ncbi:hypothetical protein ACFCX4_35705 [Kitasatospora sp. NPDC056327]|uniref:hypothetical protein n=1 Tax=Kitasatospora sp. NPDC056327 TaxID=3345785 RepID=UPI0035E0A982
MQYDPTDPQKKAFEENAAEFRAFDDRIRSVQDTARARLADSGWDPGDDTQGTLRCLSCPCPGFEFGGFQGRCKRSSCKHAFINHDLPR